MSYRRWMTPTDSLLVITAVEDTFLTEHDIDQHDVLDGNGMTGDEISERMCEEPHWRVAIGVHECDKGHALRNAHGVCVMCDPKSLAAPSMMTKEEIAFLQQHNISLAEVMLAHGLKPAAYGKLMKDKGLTAAIGVTRCKEGHRLRNRHGKCIICNPAVLVYAKRFRASAWVYIGRSRAGRLYKVGSSNDLQDRFEQLNIQGYGGRNDWELIAHAHCEEAGRAEHEVQQRLAAYAVLAGYNIRPEECRELFRCSREVVLEAFREVTGSG